MKQLSVIKIAATLNRYYESVAPVLLLGQVAMKQLALSVVTGWPRISSYCVHYKKIWRQNWIKASLKNMMIPRRHSIRCLNITCVRTCPSLSFLPPFIPSIFSPSSPSPSLYSSSPRAECWSGGSWPHVHSLSGGHVSVLCASECRSGEHCEGQHV